MHTIIITFFIAEQAGRTGPAGVHGDEACLNEIIYQCVVESRHRQ